MQIDKQRKNINELNSNVSSFLKIHKQITRLKETLSNIRLDIIDTFSNLGISEYKTTHDITAKLRHDEIRKIDFTKYEKLVNRKQLAESCTVSNVKAKIFVNQERLDKITEITTKEVLTVK